MSSRPAEPARTYAVLVGVEKYDAGAAWNKLSILRDVLEFHKWLRSRNVPAEQIVTLFSPRDESVAALAESKVGATPATSENVRNTFDSLKGKSGDLLFLFWGGHGALHEKQRCLFLADATLDNKRNINFEALRESLASTYFKGFRRQILIVDACATYEKYPFTFPGEPIPCGAQMPHEQFIFFAARPGQAAKDLGEEKRGLLSRELLKQIRELDGTSWPPDMLTLARRVQEEFAALRQSGDFRDLAQTPVFQLSQDWDGSIIELRGRKQAPGAPPPGESWQLTPKQLIPLTDALISVSRMQTSAGRDLLLAQIRSDISGAVRRGGDATSDVMNMLRTAASYPGGLEELLWFVYQFEGPSMAWGTVAQVAAERLPNLRLPSAESSEPVVDGAIGKLKLDLVAALEKCPTLADKAGRDLCVAQLDNPIPPNIARQDDKRGDLLSIVSTCLAYEGGIDSLIAAVEWREKNAVHMPRVHECARALLKTI
jgi:Effector-associated domain 2/Caspase domain